MSLIEVIVALSLVSLVTLFLFGLLPSTGLLSQQSEQQTFAASLADEIVAHLDTTGFDRLHDNLGTWSPTNPGPFSPYLTERTMKDGMLQNGFISPVCQFEQLNIVRKYCQSQKRQCA